MRISDWSSDVCSSDLRAGANEGRLLLSVLIDDVPDVLARNVLEACRTMIFEFVGNRVRPGGVGGSQRVDIVSLFQVETYRAQGAAIPAHHSVPVCRRYSSTSSSVWKTTALRSDEHTSE